MSEKHIVACSGGFQRSARGPVMGPVIDYICKLTGKDQPSICYVGTATGDATIAIAGFYSACIGKNVKPSHLQLFPMPNVTDIRSFMLSQDIIWVGGGSVANLLAVWKTHGLDAILREAWEKGIVLSGTSAGSICWHVGGTTDSFGTDLKPVTNGLALLPYSSGVHYDSEEQRRPLFQKLIADGTLPDGYATDDGVAIHYIGTEVHKAITDTPEKFAYQVTRTTDGIIETKLETTLL